MLEKVLRVSKELVAKSVKARARELDAPPRAWLLQIESLVNREGAEIAVGLTRQTARAAHVSV